MAKRKKEEIITFKADESLLHALDGIPNRSEFIRAAVLAALGNICPLCQGNGILTPLQQRHWDHFAQHHSVEKCRECAQPHLICAAESSHHVTNKDT